MIHIVKTNRDKTINRMIKHNRETRQYSPKVDLLDWYAWPGGYPLFYLTADNGALCPQCANENFNLCNDHNDSQWYIVAYDINYEDDSLFCDNCSKQIESAYGEDTDD